MEEIIGGLEYVEGKVLKGLVPHVGCRATEALRDPVGQSTKHLNRVVAQMVSGLGSMQGHSKRDSR